MAKVKVTTKFDFSKDFNNILDTSTKKKMGDSIIKDVLDFTSKGISAVRGFRKFASYKKGSKKDNGYPWTVKGKYPNKTSTPVNLFLSGKMLGALAYKTEGKSLSIGVFDAKEALKAETHNEGTQPGKVPQRKFLPTSRGDQFAVSIERNYLDIVQKRVSDIIKKSNK
jgi:hypothetical protein